MSNPFDDDNQLDDPFLNNSTETLGEAETQQELYDAPMAKLWNPIKHVPKITFKIGEEVNDYLYIGQYLITCHPLKLIVWDVPTGKIASQLSHSFTEYTCCCVCPEFEDPSVFIWLGLPNGDIWCIDLLGESLESERNKIRKYTNMDSVHGCVVLFKNNISKSPIKKLYQKGSTLIAIDAYASLFIWQSADVSSLNSQPIIIKLNLSFQSIPIVDRLEMKLFLVLDKSAYLVDIDQGHLSLCPFGSDKIASLCIGEFDGQNCIVIGQESGFILIYSLENQLLKSIHFSNYSIVGLKFRPSPCIINENLQSKPVLLICLKTGDYYQCLVDYEFSIVSIGHPTAKSEDTKVQNAALILQNIVVFNSPHSLKLLPNFVVLSRKDVVQVDVASTDLTQWTRRLILKQNKVKKAKCHPLTCRIISWNIDASKPTELQRPSVRNKKKRNRMSSLSPFRKMDSDESQMSQPQVEFAIESDTDDPLLAMFKASTIDDPDLIVVGFQEVVDLESKRVHAKSLFKKKSQKTPHDLEERSYRDWLYAIEAGIEQVYSNKYKLLKSDSLIGIFLVAFIKTELKPYCSSIETVQLKTGMKGYHGNKGAIAFRLIIFDTSIAFIVAHLAAGQKHVIERNKDVKEILRLEFQQVTSDSVYMDEHSVSPWDCDAVFFFGDLNYRIETSRLEYSNLSLQDLRLLDQLNENRLKNPSCLLRHFEELQIDFIPTYKYDPYTMNFDTSEKQRIPAWCDRILYRGSIQGLLYNRLEKPISSDHRPIIGEYKIDCFSLNGELLQIMLTDYLELTNRIEKLDFINTVNTVLNEYTMQSQVANYLKQSINLFQYLQTLLFQ